MRAEPVCVRYYFILRSGAGARSSIAESGLEKSRLES